MIARDLTALMACAGLAAALAPGEASAQTIMMGPGIRTEMTPAARAAHNGVFDGVKRRLGLGSRKVEVSVGEVEAVNRLTPEDAANSAREARPYSTDPPPPPSVAPRQVRPAQAFPPERIGKTPRNPAMGPKDDPRGVEERKDPGG